MADHDKLEFSPLEKRIIFELGGDIGEGPCPFADLAEKVGASEAEVLGIVRSLKERGCLRRFGATLRHQKSGFVANAMVAWRAPEDRIEEIGRALADFPQVTHCYRRRTVPVWTRNLYTMIHAGSDDECRSIAAEMARAAGLDDYELLFSHEELKKTSMRYFR